MCNRNTQVQRSKPAGRITVMQCQSGLDLCTSGLPTFRGFPFFPTPVGTGCQNSLTRFLIFFPHPTRWWCCSCDLQIKSVTRANERSAPGRRAVAISTWIIREDGLAEPILLDCFFILLIFKKFPQRGIRVPCSSRMVCHPFPSFIVLCTDNLGHSQFFVLAHRWIFHLWHLELVPNSFRSNAFASVCFPYSWSHERIF